MSNKELFSKVARFFWAADPYEATDHAGTIEAFTEVIEELDPDTINKNLLYFATYGDQDDRPTARTLLNEMLIFVDLATRLNHKERSTEA